VLRGIGSISVEVEDENGALWILRVRARDGAFSLTFGMVRAAEGLF
jgi:hypothetical protein